MLGDGKEGAENKSQGLASLEELNEGEKHRLGVSVLLTACHVTASWAAVLLIRQQGQVVPRVCFTRTSKWQGEVSLASPTSNSQMAQ